jgi:[protein-PII] uridylyltransferase
MSLDEVLAEPSSAVSKPGIDSVWQERRDAFRAQLGRRTPPGIGIDEVAAHFAAMPAHYWERVNPEDLVWGLEAIHGFFKMMATSNVPATAPFVEWRPGVNRGQTRIMLCTWDRHGLLAKAAAALSAVRLSILEADVFTRADNVVLDVFSVTDSDGHGAASPTRLEEMRFLVEGALSEPPRFASVWACSRHKYLAEVAQAPLHILFDNDSSPTSTLVHVAASDRLGLLYDILQTLADSGLNITQAQIKTDDGMAHDVFEVADAHGRKLSDPLRLEALRQNIERALVVQD